MSTIGLEAAPPPALSDGAFAGFRKFLYEATGIALSPAKRALVAGRLAKRLRLSEVDTFDAYYELVASGRSQAETQAAIDLLTTNETYFFREQSHFDALRGFALARDRGARPLRVWSAACSTGEEPYSIAMTLAAALGERPWEVVASDVSQRVLRKAQRGHYPLTRCARLPDAYRKRFCLRGTGGQEGTLLVDRSLRARIKFAQVNLNAPLPEMGSFDVVFLRNVMIYFDHATRERVVARILTVLQPGGRLYVGHSESLSDVSGAVRALAPAIYART